MSMVTYGDYFSRKTLHYCGVAPDKKLFQKGETGYTGMQRMEKIRSDMLEIYQTLYNGHMQKNASEQKSVFADLQVERKIVAAFYDAGILNNAERTYFQTQSLQSADKREQICVEEAQDKTEMAKTQKVGSQVKAPLSRKIPQ